MVGEGRVVKYELEGVKGEKGGAEERVMRTACGALRLRLRGRPAPSSPPYSFHGAHSDSQNPGPVIS